jgi:hypothetical protein
MPILDLYDGPVVQIEGGELIVLMAADSERGLSAYWQRPIRADIATELIDGDILQLYRNMARLCRMMPNAPYAELEVRNRHDRVIRRHCVDRELILCELDRRAAREQAGSEQEGIEYAMEPEALVFLGDPPIDERLLTLPPSAWSRLEASMHGRRRSTSLDGRAHLVEALGEEAIEGLMACVVECWPSTEQARRVIQILRPRALFERSLEKLLGDIPDDEAGGWMDVFLASVTSHRDEADLEAAFARARPEVRWRLARGFVALIRDRWSDKEEEARLRAIMAAAQDAAVDEVVLNEIGDFIPERD